MSWIRLRQLPIATTMMHAQPRTGVKTTNWL